VLDFYPIVQGNSWLVKKMRILVADDDIKITRMLKRGLTTEGHNVEIVGSGLEASRLLADVAFDLLILDIVMPEPDGITLCHRLREAGDRTLVLMLTARDEIRDRVQGLDAGADDYLVKPFAYDELLARVRALARRLGKNESTVLRFADLSLDTVTRYAQRGDRTLDPLSPTEFNLMVYLLQHPRYVLPRQQILEQVWGYDFGGEDNVLDLYISYLRRKLEAGGETRLIQTVRGVGYALRES
jgi:two-component system response regulator MprA